MDQSYDSDRDFISMEKADVLLLGWLATEGVTSAIKAAGRFYVNKSWASGSANWHRMADYLEQDHEPGIACVLGVLSDSVLATSCESDDYDAAFKRLVDLLPSKPHIIFIYEELLHLPTMSFEDYLASRHRTDFYGQNREVDEYLRKQFESYVARTEHVSERLRWLNSSGLTIYGYKSRAQLVSAAQDFLVEAFRGLTMRVYIPSSRLWAGEMGRLLNMFVEYLEKVESVRLGMDITHTGKGVIYELFHSEGPLPENDMGRMLDRFSTFLHVCMEDPAKAEQIVRQANLPAGKADELVTRYNREAKRIASDARQDLERKIMSLRHRLESEIIELDTAAPAGQIGSAEQTLAEPSAATIICGPESAKPVQMLREIPQIIMNNPQIVNSYKGIVAQEFFGQVEYSEEGQAIRDLIDRFESGYANLELKSCVDVLDDGDLPQNKREGAVQRLKAFLRRHATTIEDKVLNILFKYVDYKMTSGQ